MADGDKVFNLPLMKKRSDGSGPEGPMLEERVKALETKVDKVETRLASIDTSLAEIKGQLSQMPKGSELASIRADLGEVKGRLNNIPTTWQVVSIMLTTWSAGAAIVWAIVRYAAR